MHALSLVIKQYNAIIKLVYKPLTSLLLLFLKADINARAVMKSIPYAVVPLLHWIVIRAARDAMSKEDLCSLTHDPQYTRQMLLLLKRKSFSRPLSRN